MTVAITCYLFVGAMFAIFMSFILAISCDGNAPRENQILARIILTAWLWPFWVGAIFGHWLSIGLKSLFRLAKDGKL